MKPFRNPKLSEAELCPCADLVRDLLRYPAEACLWIWNSGTYQDPGLQTLRREHTTVRPRVLDSSRPKQTDRPQLRYKDVCKRDLNAFEFDLNRWEALASDRSAWRPSQFEETLALHTEAKRHRSTDYICTQCGRDCHSRIGLSSHTRRCSIATVQSVTP